GPPSAYAQRPARLGQLMDAGRQQCQRIPGQVACVIAVIRKNAIVIPDVADSHARQPKSGFDSYPAREGLGGDSPGHITNRRGQYHTDDSSQDDPSGADWLLFFRIKRFLHLGTVAAGQTPAYRAEAIMAAL